MIRMLTSKDLLGKDKERILFGGKMFADSTKTTYEFNEEFFLNTWVALIDSGIGVFFVYEKEGEVIGGISGLKSPDPNSGKFIAIELFWFVLPNHRGGIGGKLLKAFEGWTKDEGCSAVIMVYLVDSMPEKVERIYESKNYEKTEVHYMKRL